jgi:lipoprotein-anchoring transpeptidase ErfK/SrfK
MRRRVLLLVPLSVAAVAAWGGTEGTAVEEIPVVKPPQTPLPALAVGFDAPARTPLPQAEDLAAQVVKPAPLRERPGGPIVADVGRRTEFGSTRIMPIVKRYPGGWLGVIATERPNGKLGWIHEDNVEFVREPVRVTIDLSERELVVTRRGTPTLRMTVGVGSPATPTPTGTFAVTDGLNWKGSRVYGCCVLALSGHQPKLAQGWTGGDRLAVHGTNAPSTIGQASSLGCARASDTDMRRLLDQATLGARVVIKA